MLYNYSHEIGHWRIYLHEDRRWAYHFKDWEKWGCSGFVSVAHMDRLFRLRTGTTPSAARRR